MEPDHQEALNRAKNTALFETLSRERLGTYLVAAGHDPERALRLYLWNAQLGEAFHIPIQATEVGLRNRINYGLIDAFGADWWREASFTDLLDQDRRDDLAVVLRRIRNRKLPQVTGQIVAGLSLGFWVGLLQPRYNPPIWGKRLRVAFPHLPENKGRKSIAQAAGRMAYLRNRISHHEPIIKLGSGPIKFLAGRTRA